MRALKYAFLTVIGITFSFNSQAQYIGSDNLLKTDLWQIINKPIDDDKVKLQGYLTKKVSSDKYLFSDGKHNIRVEIDQDIFPTQPFSHRDLIQIEGQVEKDFLESPEIDVKRLTVIKQ